MCVCVRLCVLIRPLILCQDEERRHASLAPQWQGVIRAAKIPETLLFCLSYPTAQRTANSQPHFYVCTSISNFASRVSHLICSQLPISICVTHSLIQKLDSQLLQTSVISTFHDSISHFFLIQLLNDTNVTQVHPQTYTHVHTHIHTRTHTHTHRCYLQAQKHTLKYTCTVATHGCTHLYSTHTHTQSLCRCVLWKSSTKCPGSGCSSVPTDRRPYASLAPLSWPLPRQSSVCPYKDMPLYPGPLSCPVLHPAPARPVDLLPRSLNDWISLQAVWRRWWPANKREITAPEESTMLPALEIFTLCRIKILTLSVGGWDSFLSNSISFWLHVPFLISATVSSGKQHVDSKTKTHTLTLLFCLSLKFPPLSLWQPLSFPLSALFSLFSLFNHH